MNLLTKNKNILYFFSIVITGIYLRFYKISNIATFGHDNSRDLILLYKLYTYNEPIWRGPVFSIIWAHLSFIYYYILFFFVLALNFHPLSVPIFTNSINILALCILFFVSNKLFGHIAALVSTLIYAVSFHVAKEAAFGLNPSFVPPFTLLFFYSIYMILVNANKLNKHLIILAVSLVGLLSFHPSGIFALPILIIFYFLYRPKISFQDIKIPASIIFLFVVIPYTIQQKKFNFYDLKQVLLYVTSSNNEETHLNMFSYLSNFYIVLVKNISLTFFASDNAISNIFSTALILTVFYFAYGFYKNSKSPETILATILAIYTLPIGFLIKFYDTGPRSGWFQPVIVPLLVLFAGFIAAKIYISKYKKLVLFLVFISVICNINIFSRVVISEDSFSRVRSISNLIETDSKNEHFDIIGIKPQAYFYVLWFYSNNKAKYYPQIKWDKSLDAPLVYYIEQKEKLDEEKIKKYLIEKKLLKSTKIYNDEFGSVYRFE